MEKEGWRRRVGEGGLEKEGWRRRVGEGGLEKDCWRRRVEEGLGWGLGREGLAFYTSKPSFKKTVNVP